MPDQLGYPDFRRRSDYDGETLVNTAGNVVRVGPFTYGPFYVGDMAYITLRSLGGVASGLLYTFSWSPDQSFAVTSGVRTFRKNTATAQLRLPNLGRWVRLRVDPQTGATAWTDNSVLFASNRGNLIEAVPQSGLLFNASTNVAAGATQTDELADVYAGPVHVVGLAVNQPWVVAIDALTGYGTWSVLAITDLRAAAATVNERTVILPLDQCRVRRINIGAAADNIIAVITPSTSGGA